jgi:hypothetical protein
MIVFMTLLYKPCCLVEVIRDMTFWMICYPSGTVLLLENDLFWETAYNFYEQNIISMKQGHCSNYINTIVGAR